jgi:gamma-butyrobetaine dioxygenase
MLVNVQPKERAILDVVRTLFMAERGTVYGPSFTIKSVANPNNLAYNNKGLLGHTDQPYMEQPPAIQLFHCITQASEGGDSRFLDGFRLAQKVWQKDPQAFTTLSQHQVLYHDLTPQWHLEAYHSVFQLAGSDGSQADAGAMPKLKRIAFNEQCRDSWRQYDPNDASQSSASLDQFYHALTMLEKLVWEEEEFGIRLQPGEVIVSDNWRTLHNRSGFVGERHFEGCYIDWDVAEAIWRRSSRAVR